MGMTYDRFTALVQRLEVLAQERPQSYRLRLALLASLGYIYILVFLLASLLALALLAHASIKAQQLVGGMYVNGALVILVVILVRSLWIRIPRPEGIPLSREQVPELFATLDEIRLAVRGPRLAQVLLDGDYNASVSEIPRLSVLGWYVSYLSIGLPYLQTVSAGQLRGVLAHEMGHLSEYHGRFAVWIGRLRATWAKLMAQLHQHRQRAAFVFNWFSEWYGPLFSAYSYVLARAHERSADRYAEELAGAETCARALSATAVYDRFLDDRFWPEVLRQVRERPSPPPAVYAKMVQALQQPLPQEQAEKWLVEALSADTDVDDTHPSLQERLAALGLAGALENAELRRSLLPQPPQISAADHYLREKVPEYAAALSAIWEDLVKPEWQQRHGEAQEAEARLQELGRKAEHGQLSREEASERAALMAHFREADEAIPVVRELVARYPDIRGARYTLGRLLLERDDPAGVALIEETMASDIRYLRDGCMEMYQYLRRQGRNEEARRYRKRASDQYDAAEAAERERMAFSRRDVFLPHDLLEPMVEAVRSQLKAHPEVKEVYLVLRDLPGVPGQKSYVVGVVPRFRRRFYLSEATESERLYSEISKDFGFSYDVVLVVIADRHTFLRKKMRNVQGALIYERRR